MQCLLSYVHTWQKQAAHLEQGGVIKKEYDQWRYKSPELDTVKHQQKIVPSQKSSDYLVESLKRSRIRLKTTFLPSKMQKTLLFSASKYLKNSKVFMLLKYFI